MRAQLAERLAGPHLTAPLAKWLRGLKPDALTSVVGAGAFAFSVRVFATVAYCLSALFLALYILIDRDRLRGGLFAVVPRSHHIRLSRVMMNLETIVGSYIRGQMVTSLLMSIFAFVLLTACGVENALALAVFAGLADVLPYIGPTLSIGPAVLAALPRGPGRGRSSCWSSCSPTRSSRAACSSPGSTAGRCAFLPPSSCSRSWRAERSWESSARSSPCPSRPRR